MRVRAALPLVGFAVLCASVTICTLPSKVAAFSGGGAGSVGDPYQVTNCAQLQSLHDATSAHYKLIQDVDCGGVAFLPIARSGGLFTGSLDGQGHRIDNLTIETEGLSFTGLFSRLGSTAIVKNLAVFAHVSGDSSNTGMVAGSMLGDSQITNVGTHGTVSCGSAQYCGGVTGFLATHAQISRTYSRVFISSSGDNVGGLVGRSEGDTPSDRTTITNAYYNGTIDASSDRVGGIVGSAEDTTMTYSYAAGEVTGADQIGGLAGAFGGFMAETFAAIKVNGTGGAVGPVTGHFISGSVGNRYFDVAKTGFSSSPDGSTPISDSNYFLGNSTNPPFDTWDFSTVWVTNYQDYPSFAPLVDPYMECEQLVITETTARIYCRVQPPGWGTPTWEFRYRKASSNMWTNVTLPDVHRNEVTVAGLTPGTDYVFQFRYTNNFGVGPWGNIFGTTLGTAPPEPIVTEPSASTAPTVSVSSTANSSSDASTSTSTPTPTPNKASNPTITSPVEQETSIQQANGLPVGILWGGAGVLVLGLVWLLYILTKRA